MVNPLFERPMRRPLGVNRFCRGLSTLPLTVSLAVTIGLSGCASRTAPVTESGDALAHWQGRMAVKVYSTPVQAFNASFDLQGKPEQGQLLLSTPLGTTVAEIRWAPGLAQLKTEKENKVYLSLGALAQDVTGASIPVADMFAWLQGTPSHNGEWQADLSDLATGRLTAYTLKAMPPAELKVILDP